MANRPNRVPSGRNSDGIVYFNKSGIRTTDGVSIKHVPVGGIS